MKKKKPVIELKKLCKVKRITLLGKVIGLSTIPYDTSKFKSNNSKKHWRQKSQIT